MANTNPHHEELDGCDHGATGKPCRPDPSSNGKDCLEHGNHGGVNEDHCLTTTTTPTTVPVSPTTTTTTTTITTTKGGENTTTPTSGSPVSTITSTTPVLGCMSADGFPYLTNIEQGGCPAPIVGTPVAQVPTSPVSRDTLPATGVDAGALALVGVGAILIGRLLRRATR